MKKFDGYALFLNSYQYRVDCKICPKLTTTGEFTHRNQHGIIRLKEGVADMETLLHEVIHAILHSHGYAYYCFGGFFEEVVCDKLSTELNQCFHFQKGNSLEYRDGEISLYEIVEDSLRGTICNDAFDNYINDKNREIKKDAGEPLTSEPKITNMGEVLTELLTGRIVEDLSINFLIRRRKDAETLWKQKLERKSKKK